MSQPILTPQWSDADAFYDALMQAHSGLTPEQSVAFNARLILILANQIGDSQQLGQCIELAKLPV